MLRSDSGISAIFASRALSPSALRASAFSSWARSRIAARSSAVNPLEALLVVVFADCCLPFLAGFLSAIWVSFRAFDDLREAVEPLQPRADALEGVGREHARADTADLLRRDELRVLEQPDVLLHPGERHAEGLGELADRRAARAEPFEHGASGRVGEGGERPVDGGGILNHRVQYCTHRPALGNRLGVSWRELNDGDGAP